MVDNCAVTLKLMPTYHRRKGRRVSRFFDGSWDSWASPFYTQTDSWQPHCWQRSISLPHSKKGNANKLPASVRNKRARHHPAQSCESCKSCQNMVRNTGGQRCLSPRTEHCRSVEMWKCASVEINNIQYQCPGSLDTGAGRWLLVACTFAHLHIVRRKRQRQQFLTPWPRGWPPQTLFVDTEGASTRCGIFVKTTYFKRGGGTCALSLGESFGFSDADPSNCKTRPTTIAVIPKS